MTRRITNDEYLTLALRYNEQRTINDSLQKEITELKEKNEIWGRYVRECMTEMDELKDKLDEFIVDEDQKYDARVIRVSGNLDNDTNETADEWNNRNRIS
jgi:FtsZ-binding cell division protein ZapB